MPLQRGCGELLTVLAIIEAARFVVAGKERVAPDDLLGDPGPD